MLKAEGWGTRGIVHPTCPRAFGHEWRRFPLQLSTRKIHLGIDSAVFAASLYGAYLVSLDGNPGPGHLKPYLLGLPFFLGMRLAVSCVSKVHLISWRYISLPDGVAIARSLIIPSAVLLVLSFCVPPWLSTALSVRAPATIIALECFLSLAGTLGTRVLYRIIYEQASRGSGGMVEARRRIVLYGAGWAGVILLKELANHGELEVLGFVDDDATKLGTVIMGRPVLGTVEDLSDLVQGHGIEEVVISIAKLGRARLAEMVARCEKIPVRTRIVPPLEEIADGRIRFNHLREVRVQDLLGRESVELPLFDGDVRRSYAGKRILITGAGGSIGSELVRQVLQLRPGSVAMLDKDENAVHELQQELSFSFPASLVQPMIADLRHPGRLRALFDRFQPQIVFHAAAHKHVPLMESQAPEALLNNVGGTRAVLDLSCQKGVEQFVFISSDKAVKPANVMGASKHIGEMLVRAYSERHAMRSACVRFGNVLGSRGSVIPLFQQQIARGGPVTVTHPEVMRFFMTIPEAVQLVLCAGAMTDRGTIFVLDMGNPRRILELAQEMVRLSGLEVGRDIEIKITGLRPGEKMVEELLDEDEHIEGTRFDKLKRVVTRPLHGLTVLGTVDRLLEAAYRDDEPTIYHLLQSMTIGYRPFMVKGPSGLVTDSAPAVTPWQDTRFDEAAPPWRH